MLLPYEVQKEVHDFFFDIEEYNLNCDFSELTFSRGKKNYDRILRRLENVNLPDPTLLRYQSLSTKEIKEYLIEILCKIFGKTYKDELERYNRLVKIAPIENPFDAVIESDLIGDKEVPKKILISNKCQSIQIVSTGHEYVHCFLSQYSTNRFNKVINNVHYNELLPIIVEYIICYELSQILKEENLEEKHQLIRIDHDKNQAAERFASLNLEAQLRKSNNMDAQMLKKYIEYQEHNSFGYILSDIYAIYLLDVYKDNSDTITSIIKLIISGEKSINDLINYFNLSLTDIDIINKYNKSIDQIVLTKSK